MNRPWVGVVLVLCLSVALVGCTKRTVGLDPADLDMEACSGLTTVRVEDLAQPPNGTCDLQGVSVVFPDGFEVVAPSFGGIREVAEGDSDFYTLFNDGSLGLVVGQTNPERTETQWWGTAEGIEAQQGATGSVIK